MTGKKPGQAAVLLLVLLVGVCFLAGCGSSGDDKTKGPSDIATLQATDPRPTPAN